MKYEVGYVRSVPIPNIDEVFAERLGTLARAAYQVRYEFELSNECRRLFIVPSLCLDVCESLSADIAAWAQRMARHYQQLQDIEEEINDISFRLYSIYNEDRKFMQDSIRLIDLQLSDDRKENKNDIKDEEYEEITLKDTQSHILDLLSYLIGCIVGRWDVRLATGERNRPVLTDPFAPLPVCSPGMLQGPDGLPLTETPKGYPLLIDWDGILVNDPDHQDDIIRCIRDVLELRWKDRADAIEKEAYEIVGVKDLRDYFRKPGKGGFWDDHIKRYSKSRRKAPIYWLLQSSKKNYALWLYYHRLDKDILFKALLNYVEPKIRLEESRLAPLRAQRAEAGTSGKEAKKLERDLERQGELISELRDFEDKLRRVANLHLDPDLNDGVVLNIAPLRELVPWKEAQKYWDELLAGKYEWSSIGKQLREKGIVSGP